ncbi:MAG: M15 family metallopeptidase [Acidimicrobiales bacterium]
MKPRRAGLALAVALVTTACAGGDATVTPGPTSTSASAVPSTAPPPTTVPPTTVPPTTAAPKAAPPTGLADVQELEPSVVVALKGLNGDNFTGGPLPGYETHRAFLQPPAAEALARVQRGLATRNLGLKIYDGYRPYRATQYMVDWARSHGQGHLVGPYIATVSYHNSGQAVDLTLVERSTGRDIDMGTGYEAFGPAVHTANATGVAAENRAILVNAMHAEGFENYPGEWWHFNYFVAGAKVLDEPVR